MKRLLTILLTLSILLSLFPVISFAAESLPSEKPYVFTEADYAEVDALWAEINEKKSDLTASVADPMTIGAAIAELVMNSDCYRPDSIEYFEDCFAWKTDNGIACRYYYVEEEEDRGESVGEPIVPPESGYEFISYAKKGAPAGKDVYLIGPFYGVESDFTTHYQGEAKALAAATGGTYTMLAYKAATVDTVANAFASGSIVLVDSHGSYNTINGVSRSYLRLKTGVGITDSDYDNGYAYISDSKYMVSGEAISAHMKTDAPNSFVWYGICSGMRYKSMHAPVIQRGVEACFGYSRTVSFAYDRNCLSALCDSLIAGNTLATAISSMKSSAGKWDHADDSASDTLTEAINEDVAFPIVVSDQDTYPSSLQAVQTVNSTWTLKNCTHSAAKHIPAVNATCTTAGNRAHYYCSNCKSYYADSSFHTEIDPSGFTFPALGHSMVNGACSRCGSTGTAKTTKWDFNKGSAEAAMTWVAVDAQSGTTSGVNTDAGVLQTTSNGSDNHIYMQLGTGSFGHTFVSGDILEIRYRSVNIPAAKVGTSGPFDLWYTTTSNDSSFSSSMVLSANVVRKESEWQTVQFTPTAGTTLKRLLFDVLEEDQGYEGARLEIDYIYAGPVITEAPAVTEKESYPHIHDCSDGICTICGEIHSHDFTAKYSQVITAPTCTAPGNGITTCSDCGKSVTVSIPRTNHTLSGNVCTACGYVPRSTLIHFAANTPSATYTWNTYDGSTKVTTSGTGTLATTLSSSASDHYMTLNEEVDHYVQSGDIIEIRYKVNKARTTASRFELRYTTAAGASSFGSSSKTLAKDVTFAADTWTTVQFSPTVGHTIYRLFLEPFYSDDSSFRSKTFTMDYIYIGPANGSPSKVKSISPLYFDFTNDTQSQQRFLTSAYGYMQTIESDLDHWVANSNRNTKGIRNGTLEMNVLSLGSPYVQLVNASGSTAHANFPLNYVLDGTDYAQICVKFEGCKNLLTDKNAAINFNYFTDKTIEHENPSDQTIYNYGATLPIHSDYLIDGQYHIYTIPLSSSLTIGETMKSFRVSFSGVGTKANTTGKITIDYIAVGALNELPVKEAYTATFHDADGKVLQTQTITRGETALYRGALTKAADNDHHYTFKGWDKNPAGITADTTFVPQFTAEGHTLTNGVVTPPSCTQDGYTTYQCSVCDHTFIKDQIPAGHTAVIDKAVPATCTAPGKTEGTHCSVCGTIITAQQPISALGHDPIYTNNGGDHTVGCSRCTVSSAEAHNYVNGTCICGAAADSATDSGLVFYNMSMDLQSYIGVNYMVRNSVAADYDSFYVGVKQNDGEEIILQGTALGSTFTYFSIRTAAPQMTENLAATIYAVKNGVTYHGETVNWTVRDGIMEQMNAITDLSTVANKNRMTLMVDMLNYGTAAQLRFNNRITDLACSKLTQAQLAYGTATTPSTTATVTESANAGSSVKFLNKTLSLQSSIEMQFVVNIGSHALNDLEARISHGGTNATVALKSYAGSYAMIIYDGIAAKDVRTPVNITIYSKSTGKAVSNTLTCSIEALAATMLPDQADIVYAMLRYGDAANKFYG